MVKEFFVSLDIFNVANGSQGTAKYTATEDLTLKKLIIMKADGTAAYSTKAYVTIGKAVLANNAYASAFYPDWSKTPELNEAHGNGYDLVITLTNNEGTATSYKIIAWYSRKIEATP